MNYIKLFLVSCLVWAGSSASFADNRLYRYIDDNGQTVIRSTISPDKVALGYEVLDDKGRVIEKIDPLEENASEKYKQRQAESRKKQAQEEYDLSLIRRYSFVKDIEVERDRKLDELKVRVSILKGNLNGIRAELESAFGQAAKIERKGKTVDDGLKQRIESLEQKIISTEDVIKKRQEALEALEKEYVLAIERFSEIQALRGR